MPHRSGKLDGLLADPRIPAVAGSLPRTLSFLRARPTASGRTLGLGAQVLLDEVVISLLRNPALFPSAEDIAVAGTEVRAAHEYWRTRGWTTRPESYHRPPGMPEAEVRLTSLAGRHHHAMRFPVDYEPEPGEPGRDRWLAQAHNRTARVSLLRQPRSGRPWLICVHGFGMGQLRADLAWFRSRRLHQDLGLNLALPVLPSHGPRISPGLRTGEGFTSVNIVDGIHGVAQSVWEIRALVRWIRDTDPTAPIGLYGVSLGSCVASVAASLEPDLACVVAGIPVSNLFDLYLRNSPAEVLAAGRLTGATGPEADEIARVVSPLHLQPLVPRTGRHVIAGVGDRMSTPEQAEALWEHWQRPSIHWYRGGHVGYFFTRRAQRAVEAAVRRSLLG